MSNNGHVHKYDEAVLWTQEKLRIFFCYEIINFSLRKLKFSGNMYFSYTERLTSTKVVEKKTLCYREMMRESNTVTIICLTFKESILAFWKSLPGHSVTILGIENELLFFFNWDSLHAKLNSYYEAWSYKKRSTKKITGYRKSV